MAKYRKLGRTSSQRKALLRNQITALLYKGRIITTEAKAKEIRKGAEHLIALAVKEGAYTDNEFFAYAMAPVFDGNDVSDVNSYKSSISDDGYLNTLYFYYEAGTLTTPSGEFYLVGYEYPVAGKELIFMVATRERSTSELLKAKDILDRMLYTLLIFNDGKVDDATEVLPSSEDTYEATEQGKVTVVNGSNSSEDSSSSNSSIRTDTPDFLKDENLSKEDKFAILDKATAEREYKAEYPNAKDLEKQVTVTEELADKDVVFFIFYTMSDSVPEEAYLFGPDGATYAPNYKNSNGDGFVCWSMSNPPIGTYTIHLSANLRYGSYKGDVLEKSVFRSLYGDVDEPIEHPSD